MLTKIGTWIGTIAGVALGSLLYGVEKLTGLKVYALLMNVDFIPGVRHAMGNPVMEWLLHLMISWVIGIGFVYILDKWHKENSSLRYALSALLSFGAASTYVPLTLLARQSTPAVTDMRSVSYWLAAHTLYGLTLVSSYDMLMEHRQRTIPVFS